MIMIGDDMQLTTLRPKIPEMRVETMCPGARRRHQNIDQKHCKNRPHQPRHAQSCSHAKDDTGEDAD